MTFASIKALADAKASEVVMFAAKSHSKRSPSGLAMRVVLGTSHVRDVAVGVGVARIAAPARRVGRVGEGKANFHAINDAVVTSLNKALLKTP